MTRMDERLAAEADVVAAEVGRAERQRFERLRIAAPAGKTVALIEYEGREHRVPVDDGVFALMLRAAIEPTPTLTRARFE
jgi:hypothetical protein